MSTMAASATLQAACINCGWNRASSRNRQAHGRSSLCKVPVCRHKRTENESSCGTSTTPWRERNSGELCLPLSNRPQSISGDAGAVQKESIMTSVETAEDRPSSLGVDSAIKTKVAIVTGASRGIGLGITERLLEMGYCVVANSS